MDRELLARKLYHERVSELAGRAVDEREIEPMWEHRTTPEQAARSLQSCDMQSDTFQGPAWLQRYLTR